MDAVRRMGAAASHCRPAQLHGSDSSCAQWRCNATPSRGEPGAPGHTKGDDERQTALPKHTGTAGKSVVSKHRSAPGHAEHDGPLRLAHHPKHGQHLRPLLKHRLQRGNAGGAEISPLVLSRAEASTPLPPLQGKQARFRPLQASVLGAAVGLDLCSCPAAERGSSTLQLGLVCYSLPVRPSAHLQGGGHLLHGCQELWLVRVTLLRRGGEAGEEAGRRET